MQCFYCQKVLPEGLYLCTDFQSVRKKRAFYFTSIAHFLRICEVDDRYDEFSELPLFGFVIHNGDDDARCIIASVMSR